LFSNMFAFQKPLTFARFKKGTVSMFWRQMWDKTQWLVIISCHQVEMLRFSFQIPSFTF
jgi:hypothetical protein